MSDLFIKIKLKKGKNKIKKFFLLTIFLVKRKKLLGLSVVLQTYKITCKVVISVAYGFPRVSDRIRRVFNFITSFLKLIINDIQRRPMHRAIRAARQGTKGER